MKALPRVGAQLYVVREGCGKEAQEGAEEEGPIHRRRREMSVGEIGVACFCYRLARIRNCSTQACLEKG